MVRRIRFLQKLFADKIYGTITLDFGNGNAAHVEMNSTSNWKYKDLP